MNEAVTWVAGTSNVFRHLALVLVALASIGAKAPEVGVQAPPFELTLVDGTKVSSADLRGQVVVLNLWGSWCTPCRSEAPALVEASEQVDAAFVGMSFRESSFDAARAFEREFGITYPTIADRMTMTATLATVSTVELMNAVISMKSRA